MEEEAPGGGGGRPRSDSDLARELQAQLDAGNDDFNYGNLGVGSGPMAIGGPAGSGSASSSSHHQGR